MRHRRMSSLLSQGTCALKFVQRAHRNCVYRARLALTPGGTQSGWAQYLMPRIDGLFNARTARPVGDLH